MDDYQVQSVLETSPPKWHLAHVTWFFETFILKPFAPGYMPFDARYAELFNSYYNTVGPFHPRPQRHTLSRPTVEEIYAYRAHVDTRMNALIDSGAVADNAHIAERLTLGVNHEQQHQELIVMDVKRNFFANPLYPAYVETPPRQAETAPPMRWLEFGRRLTEIGHADGAFAFDNERPRHEVVLRDYALASRPTTNGEYLEFIEDNGYSRADLWLSDGWTAIAERGWKTPLYWVNGGDWREMTMAGLQPLDRNAPVCHVSYYEADAYARWRGARLPTEAEWECAAAAAPIEGNFVESARYRPRAAVDANDAQWYGDVWEWTSSAYAPYPGYAPLAGSLGEYNGKFMANQYVLRGGSCATPQSHMRATYRNFFYPHDRWAFSGIRLARDVIS